MARFCRYCGSAVGENASFCRSCGRQLTAAAPQKAEPQTRTPQAAHPARQQQQRKAPAESKVRTVPAKAKPEEAAVKAPSGVLQKINTLAASAAAGETDFGELQLPDAVSAVIPETGVVSPVRGILRSAGSFLRGIADIFRKPSALIGTLVLAALWFALSLFRDSNSQIVRILSWITFSEGGLDRSLPGMVGGALGKGTVAAALASLFTGGLKDLFKGIYELARSLTSRAADGVRTAVQGRCDGLLTGLTMGFALATALTALAGTLGGLLK